MSEGDAVAYLSRNNNFFRLRSYRTNFPKVEEGSRKGQYANLDFKMLVDLSIVDMLLRYEMLPDMGSGKPMFKARNAISVAIGQIDSVGKGQRRAKLNNDRLQQVATTLYVHREFASDGVRRNRSKSLQSFVQRMLKHWNYYRGQLSNNLGV